MAPESERPIEKLLRAFAGKRRGQAGDAFELSAAARRRLLREAAALDAERGGWGRLWRIWCENWAPVPALLRRPGFAAGLAIAVVLGVVAVTLVPPRQVTEGARHAAMGKDAEVLSQTATVAKAPADTLKQPTREPDFRATKDEQATPSRPDLKEQNEKRVASAPGASSQASASSAAPAPPPLKLSDAPAEAAARAHEEAPPVPGPTLAVGGGAGYGYAAKRERSGGSLSTAAAPTTSIPLSEVATSGRAQPMTAGTAIARREQLFRDSAAQKPASSPTLTQRYLRVQAAQTADEHGLGLMGAELPAEAQPRPAPLVLSSFEVERNGKSVRILDADGSVYSGQFNPAAKPPGAAQPSEGLADSGVVETFKASGTNLTLGQVVVITGSINKTGQPPLQGPAGDVAGDIGPGNEGELKQNAAAFQAAVPQPAPNEIHGSIAVGRDTKEFRAVATQ